MWHKFSNPEHKQQIIPTILTWSQTPNRILKGYHFEHVFNTKLFLILTRSLSGVKFNER